MELFEFDNRQFRIARFAVAGSDSNYSYAVTCEQTGRGVIIDPLSPGEIIEYMNHRNIEVKFVINTHSHPDHISGNGETVRATGAKVVSHPLCAEKTGADETADEGSVISFGNCKMEVMHTPGHCADHITLVLGGNAFVGDTLFLSGCGNTRFGGNTGDLFESVRRLGALDGGTRIFCGHNYAETNLKFSLSIEPENPDTKEKLRAISAGNPVSTIAEEKLYNPFLRCAVPEVAARAREAFGPARNEAEIFAALRELRNNW